MMEIRAMSVETEPTDLVGALHEYGFAYLITMGQGERAHVVPVTPTLDDRQVTVSGLGRRSMANATAHAAVTLVGPPATADGYSLIIDGQAKAQGDGLRITPTRAVLHRTPSVPRPQAQPAASGACAADCVELSFGIS
jgi:hypothetical protein